MIPKEHGSQLWPSHDFLPTHWLHQDIPSVLLCHIQRKNLPADVKESLTDASMHHCGENVHINTYKYIPKNTHVYASVKSTVSLLFPEINVAVNLTLVIPSFYPIPTPIWKIPS